VIGDPVQRRRRHDRVNRLVQLEVERVLAPHLSAISQASSTSTGSSGGAAPALGGVGVAGLAIPLRTP
jgi:hypothetical protein